ncbi:hypothetical protein [Rhodopirellula bahusiensis]|uniref:Membrane or secreted protein n=1 Tax=Rhodopirellula bahusiensis TaxID=2014065 RepID=A0A2G1WDF5_9BACT|nr:hypothetical protein [Rhodopirellula bahusiensis]PHQ37036.1 hypothetical protein CEE69_01300 [Rhodopirellula bahusiensis]
MANLSPYQRSDAELGRHLLSTAVFLVVAASAFVGTAWIANPDIFPFQPKPIDPVKRDETTVVDNSKQRTDDGPKDWGPSVDAVTESLPQAESREVARIRQRLNSVVQTLDGEELSPDAEAEIQMLLNELAGKAAILSRLSKPPTINVDGVGEAMNSKAQSRRMAEIEAIRRTRTQTEQNVRREKDKAIRPVRLGLRDQQDHAKRLRVEIEQTQREQEKFKAKTARAEALRREMPDVQKYLVPFTSPGYRQPNSDSNPWDNTRTAEAKPVSLSRLKRLGALDYNLKGLENLYIFGGIKARGTNNTRPLGSFPEYASQRLNRPEVRQPLERAQQLLRDHGQAMVEQQLLSP